MMTRRRIVYPLFFVVVLALIVIPSVPKVHAGNPILVSSVQNAALCDGACASPSLTGITAGDFVLVHTFCMVGGGVAGVTDTFGDVYTNIVGVGRENIFA